MRGLIHFDIWSSAFSNTPTLQYSRVSRKTKHQKTMNNTCQANGCHLLVKFAVQPKCLYLIKLVPILIVSANHY